MKVPMLQNPDEIGRFADLLVREGVRSYLEIGSYCGGSLSMVAHALGAGARVVSVDLPGANGGETDSRDQLARAADAIAASGRSVTVILGNSHSPAIVRQVEALGPFDAVMIDADHIYAAAAADWANYGRLGRIVGIHDIASKFEWIEVPQFWAEIRQGRRHIEIVAEGSELGIGVLWNDAYAGLMAAAA